MAKKSTTVAGVDASTKGTQVQKITKALQKSKESKVIATQAEVSKVSHKPNPVKTDGSETKRAVNAFQERRKELRARKEAK